MAYEITQAIFDRTIEMVNDQTAMQYVGSDFTVVSGVEKAIASANASTPGTITSTSGGLTMVDTSTGIITLGRSGKFKLAMAGSMVSSIASSTIFELKIELYPAGGSAWEDTEVGVNRDLSSTSHGSFGASFHGARVVGDQIRVALLTNQNCTITFTSLGIITEWMS